ncbi:MAG: hypothetical protein H0T46_24855 [Deltaproteobacteria bacterium]|nr:hypothetical protein [Deltaproteobacteria bacterium]
MGKSLAVLGLACVAGGCLWERDLAKRPARMQLGFNTRSVATDVPKPEFAGGVHVARTTGEPAPTTERFASKGVTGNAQFTMGYRRGVYMGAELEAGPMSRDGAYFGGAYGVVGADTSSARGSLSVELIAGRRWLRTELGADDIASVAIEPRVRGQLLVGPQVTIGGVIGANAVPGEHGWMAGIYIGLFSHDQNAKPRK